MELVTVLDRVVPSVSIFGCDHGITAAMRGLESYTVSYMVALSVSSYLGYPNTWILVP